MTYARFAAIAAAAAALSACAATPRYGIYEGPADPAAPAQGAAIPVAPVAMAPVPNPGQTSADPAPRAAPSGRVAQAALPPVAGASPPSAAQVAAAATPLAAPAPARPATYRVRPGDTLFSVARQFELHPRALADANGMTFQTLLRTGQTIRIPGGTADLDAAPRELAQATAVPPPAARPTPPPPARTVPATPPRTTPPPTAAAPPRATPPATTAPAIIPTTPAPPAGDVAALGRGLFQWPLNGAILTRFGATGPGQRNDGINIAAAAGAPVRAAAAGEVAYTGNSVPGFGNLVLIRHPGGWVTAYGHLQSSTVRMRQAVTQGEQIGVAGQTGAVTQPQLHFEIRYAPSSRDRARPVDPLTLLPPTP